jgi:hypothetical protein
MFIVSKRAGTARRVGPADNVKKQLWATRGCGPGEAIAKAFQPNSKRATKNLKFPTSGNTPVLAHFHPQKNESTPIDRVSTTPNPTSRAEKEKENKKKRRVKRSEGEAVGRRIGYKYNV